ncbi:sulfate adenylyltransferase subunit 2 [Azospirillum fermentarium]|uniref:sulfate adenylyltransferase subunit CysD n=1 Tax=Azospirillum fermentarium TaxID=1233114 RepID=UPI00222626EF|nr:sulfate adenylyltransferase subunit CysD [Azospirillum fermentarium]MCW2245836.1 sulfate adenylyltransferase subunit 2 [Azospirillum fermentarium]
MNDLDQLESQSIYILREAYHSIDRMALLWSIGKDSNALLWLCRKAFFGRVPFPVVQLDTDMELPEVYEFRDRIAREWDLDLRVEHCPPESEMDPTLPPNTRAAARKTVGLRNLLDHGGYQGVVVGIRRDEQATRAKERIFSPRTLDGAWDVKDQPAEFWDHYKTRFAEGTHVRIHPLLAWTEMDIWRYSKREDIPIVPLYFSRNGKRYRSLGEKNITFPVDSNASTIDEIIAELAVTRVSERAGRTMDNESEDSFERLRSSGYM